MHLVREEAECNLVSRASVWGWGDLFWRRGRGVMLPSFRRAANGIYRFFCSRRSFKTAATERPSNGRGSRVERAQKEFVLQCGGMLYTYRWNCVSSGDSIGAPATGFNEKNTPRWFVPCPPPPWQIQSLGMLLAGLLIWYNPRWRWADPISTLFCIYNVGALFYRPKNDARPYILNHKTEREKRGTELVL